MNNFIIWCNENSGFLGLLLFVSTLVIGWISGFFKSLLNKPDIKIEQISGPALSCTFPSGTIHQNHKAHKTAVCIYIKITNISNVPTTIEFIDLGYRARYPLFSKMWLKYGFKPVYLRNAFIPPGQFSVKMKTGEKIVYPYLFKSLQPDEVLEGPYLNAGQSVKGIVYFEQVESFGGHFPYHHKNQVLYKLKVTDSFGKKYKRHILVKNVGIETARSFMRSFGRIFDLKNVNIEIGKPTAPNEFQPQNGTEQTN